MAERCTKVNSIIRILIIQEVIWCRLPLGRHRLLTGKRYHRLLTAGVESKTTNIPHACNPSAPECWLLCCTQLL